MKLILLPLMALVAGCDDAPADETPPVQPAATCEPGATVCDGGWFLRCAGDGVGYLREVNCIESGLACDRGHGCVDPVIGVGCGQGEGLCRDGQPWRCAADGRFQPETACSASQRCVGSGYCVECGDGEEVCVGGEVWRCDRTAPQLIQQCDPRVTRCIAGDCQSLCGLVDRKASYQGCQFWAVDLENVAASEEGLDANDDRVSPADAQFAVAVGNIAKTGGQREGTAGGVQDVATVSIFRLERDGEREIAKAEIPPGGLEVFELEPRNVAGSTLSSQAYRVVSDLPVVAYQFNPLNNAKQAFSNDASMLVPQAGLGDDYVVTTGDAVFGLEGGESVTWGAFVAVVGTTQAKVAVTVEMTADFEPPEGDGVTVAGHVVTAQLGAHDVLTLRSVPLVRGGAGAGNLSGVRVVADGPVAVFAGNVATLVPQGDEDSKCCADHLEEQFLPVEAWGSTVIGAGVMVRNPVEPEGDIWRVTAGPGGADLQWSPERPKDAPRSLTPLQSVQFETLGEGFMIRSDKPIQLVHFVKSSHHVGAPRDQAACDPVGDRGAGRCTLAMGFMAACDEFDKDDGSKGYRCAPLGDPAMTIVPPLQRWQREYVFLTPQDYAVDFVLVLAERSTRVKLDDELVAPEEFEEIVPRGGRDDLGRYMIPVTDGTHELVADAPVGLMIFGYDRDGSYGYPGGMDLEP